MMRISSIRPLRLKGAAPGLSSRANFGRSRKISPNGSVVRAIEVLIAVSILACGVAVIRSVSAPLPEVQAAVQPAPAQTPAATVIAINPFRSAAVPDAPQTNETDAELADTTANLRLFGTWLDAEGGSAIVSGPDEKQIRVKPGDEIAPGVSLESVHREHVVILRSGVREALRLARGLDRSGAAAVSASARPTAPSGVAVPSGMRAVDNGGRGVNIVVEGGVDPQLLASLGLEAGDVIVAIDNRPVRANVAETFGMIRGKATVPATVVRNGLTMTVELKVIDAMRLAAPMDTQALSEEVE